MLKFAVMEGDAPAVAWPLRQAHLLGPDDIAISADLELRNGLIYCSKRISGSAALAVTYPLGTPELPRDLLLRTCLLPERSEAYFLTLELARRQVMLILNKLEEWALFDESAASPLMVSVARAVELFSVAAGMATASAEHDGPVPEAERHARIALLYAVDTGEQLTLHAAQATHTRRLTGKLASSGGPAWVSDTERSEREHPPAGGSSVTLSELPQVGCCVSAAAFSPELCQALVQSCDFVNFPMRWLDMEPSEGKYAFAKTDKWIEWAILQAKLPVVAGPVLDFSAKSVPKWMAIFEHDYETMRDMVIEYIKAIVTRYRRTVTTWNICSGLHAPGGMLLSPEQAMDLTKYAVAVVRKLQPQAKVHVEVVQPFGEYTAGAKGRSCLPPTVYAELISQLNLPIDALAVRLQFGSGEPGRAARDLLSCVAMLDRLAEIEKPIVVSAFGCPSGAPRGGLDEEAGTWCGPWSPQGQATLLTKLAAALAGRPYVQAITWHELYDVPHPPPPGVPAGEVSAGGLVTSAGVAKPALAALINFRQALRSGAEKMPQG